MLHFGGFGVTDPNGSDIHDAKQDNGAGHGGCCGNGSSEAHKPEAGGLDNQAAHGGTGGDSEVKEYGDQGGSQVYAGGMVLSGNFQKMHLQRRIQKIHQNSQNKDDDPSADQAVGGGGKKQHTYSLDSIDQRQRADSGNLSDFSGGHIADNGGNPENKKSNT